jgi:hypothetical protein
MLKGRILIVLCAFLLLGGIGFGIVRLIGLRFDKGDVYPRYSSLRTDPLGSKALFDALDSIPAREVRRNHRPLRELRPAAPVTLIYAGVPRFSEWGRGELQHFEGLIAHGSRTVFAFAPASIEPPPPPSREKPEPEEKNGEPAKQQSPITSPQPAIPPLRPEPSDKPAVEAREAKDRKENVADERKPADEKGEDDETEPGFPGPSTIGFAKVAERWGATFEILQGKREGSYHGTASLAAEDQKLEPELSWHSAMRFKDLEPAWRVLYRVGEKPVVIERRWGDGTIVLVADSYMLSNEALQTELAPAFLTWLVGSPAVVIFDEEHLGVAESTGIVSLTRKYRLQGALVGVVIVVLLWFWMEWSPLVPANAQRDSRDQFVTGLDSQEGFISLLRRSIAPARIFETCVNEWRKTFSHDPRSLARMDEVLNAQHLGEMKPKDPAAAYATVAAKLHSSASPSANSLPSAAAAAPSASR